MYLETTIERLKYKPTLPVALGKVPVEDIELSLTERSAFVVEFDGIAHWAISRWVSPKRTRSYSFARVYDTLRFSGKRLTVIPVIKDEGIKGDRDFIQWDTISLMSLLDVNVILAYYSEADSSTVEGKISRQRFDFEYVLSQLHDFVDYQSSALHWNLDQAALASKLAVEAIGAYEAIGRRTGVSMHSGLTARRKIDQLVADASKFKDFSRSEARSAQGRELLTTHALELVDGNKTGIAISNYLGGLYQFAIDDVSVSGSTCRLMECKNSTRAALPSLADIKDGLIKMALYSNIETVMDIHAGKTYTAKAALRLTNDIGIGEDDLSRAQRTLLEQVRNEGAVNGFDVVFG